MSNGIYLCVREPHWDSHIAGPLQVFEVWSVDWFETSTDQELNAMQGGTMKTGMQLTISEKSLISELDFAAGYSASPYSNRPEGGLGPGSFWRAKMYLDLEDDLGVWVKFLSSAGISAHKHLVTKADLYSISVQTLRHAKVEERFELTLQIASLAEEHLANMRTAV